MSSMLTRKGLAHFLSSPENARELNGLVEVVRYVLMGYQVRTPKRLIPIASDICQTSLQRDIYDESCQLIVSLIPS